MEAADTNEIKGMLQRLLAYHENNAAAVDVAEGMLLTGTKTSRSFHRIVQALGVKPFTRGHYYRNELVNAIARKSLAAPYVSPPRKKKSPAPAA